MKKISPLVLFALLLLLLACRTENLIEESNPIDQSSPLRLSSKTISLSEAKHKQNLITELTKAKTLLSSIKSDAFGKTVNYGNGFTINTDKVLYIESDTHHYSYTFNIQKDNQSENEPLENLVLSPLADGTFKELLVSYNFTPQEKHTLLIGGTIDTKDKVTVTELTKGMFNDNGQLEKTITGSTCGYEEEQVWISCSEHVHDQNNIPSWLECEAERPPSMYTIITWKCHYTTDVGTPGNPGGGGNGGDIGGGTGDLGTPTQPVEISSFPIFVKNLQSDLKAVINNVANAEFKNGLQGYYDAFYGSNEAKIFINWAIQFKADNPSTTWFQFQNWFMTKSEGQDGIYNEAEETAFAQQTFQQHQLPGMAQYELAFPSKPNTLYPDFYRDAQPNYVVYNDYVGGKLKQLFNQNGGANNTDNPYYNTCAVRQSYALNKLGIMIPFQHVDLTGDNNWNYIMTASKMGIFLEKTFGSPNHKLEGADANDKTKIAKFLEGKTGIYLVINKNRDEAGYTGHTDMIKNGYVSGGSNVTYPNGDIIKGGIKYIYIWELN